jgi:hypothetical protein
LFIERLLIFTLQVDQSFGAISSIGTLPSIQNAPTHGNAPAVNTGDIFGALFSDPGYNPMPNFNPVPNVNPMPNVNPVPNVNIATNTTTTTAYRPPPKKKRVTKRNVTTAGLDAEEEDDGIPEGDPQNPSDLGYWRKMDSATGGKYINEFERFLHRHVVKTGNVTFRLDVPDPLLVQMLQDARTTYLQQPGRPVPIRKLMCVAC